jgi:hypothetical protein
VGSAAPAAVVVKRSGAGVLVARKVITAGSLFVLFSLAQLRSLRLFDHPQRFKEIDQKWWIGLAG